MLCRTICSPPVNHVIAAFKPPNTRKLAARWRGTVEVDDHVIMYNEQLQCTHYIPETWHTCTITQHLINYLLPLCFQSSFCNTVHTSVTENILIDWLSFTYHPTQNRSFRRCSPKLISWLGMKKINITQQKHAFTNQKKCTTSQNKCKN